MEALACIGVAPPPVYVQCVRELRDLLLSHEPYQRPPRSLHLPPSIRLPRTVFSRLVQIGGRQRSSSSGLKDAPTRLTRRSPHCRMTLILLFDMCGDLAPLL